MNQTEDDFGLRRFDEPWADGWRTSERHLVEVTDLWKDKELLLLGVPEWVRAGCDIR